MSDNPTPPQGGTTHAQLDYDRIETTIDVVEDDIDELKDEVLGAFRGDVEDIEDRLEVIEDAVNDAQDDEGENPLGPVPAQLDYVQRVAQIVREETDAESAPEVSEGLEAIEEQLEGVHIDQTAWYALVDGVPEVYNQQVVNSQQLKKQGDVQGDTEEFTVKAVPSPSADLSDSIANFPEDDQDVDLGEFTYFLTEKTEGGVV